MSDEMYNEEISFEKIMESLDIPRWFKILLFQIWDLKKGNRWTMANLEVLIKQTVDENEDNVRSLMEDIISKEKEKNEAE